VATRPELTIKLGGTAQMCGDGDEVRIELRRRRLHRIDQHQCKRPVDT